MHHAQISVAQLVDKLKFLFKSVLVWHALKLKLDDPHVFIDAFRHQLFLLNTVEHLTGSFDTSIEPVNFGRSAYLDRVDKLSLYFLFKLVKKTKKLRVTYPVTSTPLTRHFLAELWPVRKDLLLKTYELALCWDEDGTFVSVFRI